MANKAAHSDTIPEEALALGKQLCFAVYSAAHAFNRAYKPLLDRFGLTYPQYLVLLALWQQDEMTVKRIGEEIGLDSGTLSPLLKRLEAAGYVGRQRDPSDERQVIVRLTAKGQDLKNEAFGILVGISKASGCSLKQAEDIRETLHQLTRQLNAGPGEE
ncbi:MarR family winged helix-turn-helix transcriptional regulator [Ensifer sp. LBL]|uniref:MarR family winged helix-turn-helix transcriptional regulator n=1 Tax=Ensifer sp. LBL TaxID=2991056 RepID=UPI003D1F328D